MAMEEKTLRKRVLKREWKSYEKNQQPVQDQNLTIEKGWVMMMHQTDTEHEK